MKVLHHLYIIKNTKWLYFKTLKIKALEIKLL